MISCGITKATKLNEQKLLVNGFDKHIEQKQMESFLRLLLGEIRREIVVLVQFKTKKMHHS